jgi:hypothetical protein
MGLRCKGQYGCLNFYAKHGSQRAKLTIVVKNKWSRAWTQAWFYCKVPLLWSLSPGCGKDIFALHSYMTALDFATEQAFECPDGDASDVTFVKATRSIGGRDAIEEYMACGLFPLSVNFDLGEIADGETPISKLTLPLPDIPVAKFLKEMGDHFLVRVE